VTGFFISTVIIFVAELGDKSQLVALWFATRYRWWVVILGVTIATLIVHLGSVVAGRALDQLLPDTILRTAVCLSFFAFAWWSLRGDEIGDDDRRERFGMLGALGVVATSFFIAELGDKTQLATVSLAGKESSFLGVWLGSTVGMVLADALAIAIGITAGHRLPQRTIGRVAALLFVLFGVTIIGSTFI